MNQTFGYARAFTAETARLRSEHRHPNRGIAEVWLRPNLREKISGLSVQRPTLDEMLSLLRKGDTVVVSRFNRLGRSRDHLINLIGEFANRGIIFKALDLGIDSSTAAGKLVIGIFATLSEYDGNGRPAGDDSGKDAGGPTTGQSQEQAHRPTDWCQSGKLRHSQKAMGKGLSVAEIVSLTVISISSVKWYRKEIAADRARMRLISAQNSFCTTTEYKQSRTIRFGELLAVYMLSFRAFYDQYRDLLGIYQHHNDCHNTHCNTT